MQLAEGKIIKAYCGYCDVHTTDKTFLCKPCGKITFQECCVGDRVTIQVNSETEGTIQKISPRTNYLSHPHSANVDQAIIVISPQDPAIDFETIDKFLCLPKAHQITPILCFNKTDLMTDIQKDSLKAIYEKYYTMLFTSAQTKAGLDQLAAILQNKTSVFAGPSGTGKSSLINALNPLLHLRVGSVSEKNHHGKHTTRSTELLPLSPTAFVLDSPGFSNVELEVTPIELVKLFPDISALSKECKFSTCLHLEEPECAVIQATKEKQLAVSRYTSYVKFVKQALESEKNKYKRQYKNSYRKGSSKKWSS